MSLLRMEAATRERVASSTLEPVGVVLVNGVSGNFFLGGGADLLLHYKDVITEKCRKFDDGKIVRTTRDFLKFRTGEGGNGPQTNPLLTPQHHPPRIRH